MSRRAEQDPEYLMPAHAVIAQALADVLEEGEEVDERARCVLDRLADAGWYLLTYEDNAKMFDAYVMQALR